MTMPFERILAVTNCREFLISLCDPQQTPRIPKEIRKRAAQLLKHYPHEFDLMDVLKKPIG
jgi:hypothetical protein